MVKVGKGESIGDMTSHAVAVGNYVTLVFAGRRDAGVTLNTVSIYAGMVVAAVRLYIQKSVSIVAFIAFPGCCDMENRMEYGVGAIVTATAFTKYFVVVYNAGDLKSKGGMTGFAHIAGGYVIRNFLRHPVIAAVVASSTLRGISGIASPSMMKVIVSG